MEAYPSLLAELMALLQDYRTAFSQKRVFLRALALFFSEIFALPSTFRGPGLAYPDGNIDIAGPSLCFGYQPLPRKPSSGPQKPRRSGKSPMAPGSA